MVNLDLKRCFLVQLEHMKKALIILTLLLAGCTPKERKPAMFHLEQLENSSTLYQEFLRVPSMSAGLYQLEAGQPDPQTIHHEDELYYILSGTATLHIDGGEYAVRPGTIVFIPKETFHRFHVITDKLKILVFFSPQERVDWATSPEGEKSAWKKIQ